MTRFARVLLAVFGSLGIISCGMEAPPLSYESSEEWKSLLTHDAHAPRLAAAILLAREGDSSATEVLLRELPSLSNGEKSVIVDVFTETTDTKRLDRNLVDALLRAEELWPGFVLRLIAEGNEHRHVDALRRIFEKTLRHTDQSSGDRFTDLPVVARRLAACGDRKTLEECEAMIPSSPRADSQIASSARATLLNAIHAASPKTGLDHAGTSGSSSRASMVQASYICTLGESGNDAALVDLWLDTLPDETTAGRVLSMPWESILGIFDQRFDRGSLATILARQIGSRWRHMPPEQKERLSPEDRDRFLLLSARLRERIGGKDMTREEFLRELAAPYGQLVHGIVARHEAGDTDLRKLLIDKALTTTDAMQARDALYGLVYFAGGPPPDVKKRLEELSSSPSPAIRNKEMTPERVQADQKTQIRGLLVAETPEPRPTRTPNPPFREAMMPWALRRNKTNQAMADLKEIRTALDAYFVDNSAYPPGLERLTTPIAYMKAVKPDVCAPSGPYWYTGRRTTGGYAISSTGPDGRHDVLLKHLIVTLLMAQAAHEDAPFKGIDPYARLGESGYAFSADSAPGTDIVIMQQR